MTRSAHERSWLFLLIPLVASFLLGAPGLVRSQTVIEWKPVDPGQLSLAAPVVDKEAGAEALFWEVRVRDGQQGEDLYTELRHYLRVKIFDERGREAQSRVDLLYGNDANVRDIRARTIRPNGTIVELGKEDLFDRTVVKASGIKVKAKSFALPAVEPGAIVEYQWTEVLYDQVANHIRLDVQREIPVQAVRYYLNPLSLAGEAGYRMHLKWFNMRGTPLASDSFGNSVTTLQNVPAFKEEPRMPPESQLRGYMLVYYSKDEVPDPKSFWKTYGKSLFEEAGPYLKPGAEVRRAAAQAVGDAHDPLDKLSKLNAFCRERVKRVDGSAAASWGLRKSRLNKSPADTLAQGTGRANDVTDLFLALASAAGLEARPAALVDRGQALWDGEFPSPYFLRGRAVAVKIGGDWRVTDPSDRFSPFGSLRWQFEGVSALVGDPSDPPFVHTPLTPAPGSRANRQATLRLNADGRLEGDIVVEQTGHLAARWRQAHGEESSAEQETAVRQEMTEGLGGAEVTAVEIQNADVASAPLVFRGRVLSASYAQRTGRRLFFRPAVFQSGAKPVFAASNRLHGVYFPYPWSEEDQVTLDLPEGFRLEDATVPANVVAPPVGELRFTAQQQGGSRLVYRRSFAFGGDGNVLFPVEAYGGLKRFFDRVQSAGEHTFTLVGEPAKAEPRAGR